MVCRTRRAREHRPDFPTKLSQTGLFASVKDQVPAPGGDAVLGQRRAVGRTTRPPSASSPCRGNRRPRCMNHPVPIRDGGFYSGKGVLPRKTALAWPGTVVAGDGGAATPAGRRRAGDTDPPLCRRPPWRGYTYQWNERTDRRHARPPPPGTDQAFTVTDAPGARRQAPGKPGTSPVGAECITCHNPWGGYTLAFNLGPAQQGPRLRRHRGQPAPGPSAMPA